MVPFSKISVFFAIALIILIACSSENYKGKFSYDPNNAVPGEGITVKFDPAGTELESADNVDLVVYQYDIELESTDSYPMNKDGKGWKATFRTGSKIKGIIIKFVGDKVTDNNQGEGYIIKLNDEKGRELPAAVAGLAGAYSSWIRFAGIDPDRGKAIQMFKEVFKENPDLRTEYAPLYIRSIHRLEQENSYLEIEEILSQIEAKGDINEDKMSLLATWYGIIGNNEKKEEYRSLIAEKYPAGKYLESVMFNEIYEKKDPEEQLRLTKEFELKFPESENISTLYDAILNGYRDNKEYSKAFEVMKNNPDKPGLYRFYAVAKHMLGNSEDLKSAENIAKMGVDRSEEELSKTEKTKPNYLTVNEWEETLQWYAGMNYFVYGEVLSKLNNLSEAAKALKKGVEYSNGETQELNELYISTLYKSGDHKSTLEESSKLIRDGKGSEKIKASMKESYIKDKGSDTGFDSYLSEFESEANKKLKEKLIKEMISDPAPQFTLNDLDGEKVSLSDYRGKVVIIDFWATWCGPCRDSFPGMKKAIERFGDGDQVKFLFLNSWERVEDKRKNASDFIEKNSYPFHVLMDEDNKVIESFKVSGIPTKFLIDKDGNIRFKSVGFSGSSDGLVEELNAMISLLN